MNQPIAFFPQFGSLKPKLLLPPLRRDLKLFRGPARQDGSPSWTVYDPAANKFYRIGHIEFELLSLWPINDSEKILEKAEETLNIPLTEMHLEVLIRFLTASNLIDVKSKQGLDWLQLQHRMTKIGKLKWLLHHYLFFRLPLFKPDRFLKIILPYCQFFFKPWFWAIIIALTLGGVFMTMQQWDSFLSSMPDKLSWQSGLYLFLTIGFAKIIHEMGHALTARYYHCHVPTAGVAFLVMWPVLYTDTSDCWRLRSHKQRLHVGAAGMMAEFTLAGLATFFWHFLPDGQWRYALFMLASVTWITTLLINISPFMRFDGYFLLSDFLGVENLHERSFALARWRLREFLFGLGHQKPEYFLPKLERFLILFAFATWIYRLTLFLGIALLVYHLFFKLLGLFLMFIELYWFIARPIMNEIKSWWAGRQKIQWNGQTMRSSFFLLLFLGVILFPWQQDLKLPATIQAKNYSTLYAPVGAEIRTIHVKNNDWVKEEDVLLTLHSPELDYALKQNELLIRNLKLQLIQHMTDINLASQSPIIQENLAAAVTRQQGLLEQKEKLTLRAPFAGKIVQLGDALNQGRWVSPETALIRIVMPYHNLVQAYITEEEIGRMQEDAGALFYSHIPEGPERLHLRYQGMDSTNLRYLPDLYLASSFGGPIDVDIAGNGSRYSPHQTLYRVFFMIDDPRYANADLPFVQPGLVHWQGTRQSFAMKAFKTVSAILIRESGF